MSEWPPLRPDFTGENLLPQVRQFISDIPDHLFIPASPLIRSRDSVIHHESGSIEMHGQRKFIQDLSRRVFRHWKEQVRAQQEKEHQNEAIEQKHTEVAQEEDIPHGGGGETFMDEEKEVEEDKEWERKRAIEMATVRRAHAEREYDQFSSDMQSLFLYTLEHPPDTLLDAEQGEMYDPQRDHFSTLHILHSFEKHGTIPGVPRSQLADDVTVRQQLAMRKKHREKLQMQAYESDTSLAALQSATAPFQTQPNLQRMQQLLIRNPEDLEIALEDAHHYRTKTFHRLDQSVRRDQLRVLVGMKQWDAITRHSREQRGETRNLQGSQSLDRMRQQASTSVDIVSTTDMWTEYLLENFVEPEEDRWQALLSVMKQRDNDKNPLPLQIQSKL